MADLNALDYSMRCFEGTFAAVDNGYYFGVFVVVVVVVVAAGFDCEEMETFDYS